MKIEIDFKKNPPLTIAVATSAWFAVFVVLVYYRSGDIYHVPAVISPLWMWLWAAIPVGFITYFLVLIISAEMNSDKK